MGRANKQWTAFDHRRAPLSRQAPYQRQLTHIDGSLLCERQLTADSWLQNPSGDGGFIRARDTLGIDPADHHTIAFFPTPKFE